MTPKDYLTKKHFCPIPWTGFMYNFDGNVKNCIRSNDTIGNIQYQSIEQILTGVKNTQTKHSMLEDKPEPRCQSCYNLEKENNGFDIISDRVFYLKELKSVSLDNYDDFDKFNLFTADVRWSNLCNFACVYCSSEFSSKWAEELKIPIVTPDKQNKENLKNYLFQNVKQLKHVYLAGGEPLLMKENLEFLNLLINNNSNVNLRINTNLSKVNSNIFELICKFKNVHWIVSIESIYDEYEYIRYGSKWSDFVDNLKVISTLNHKISFNMLYFALNSTSIFDCIDFLKGLGFHNNSFIIGPLSNPLPLNVRHLPDNMLELAKKELQKRIDERPGFLLQNGLQNVLKYFDQPFDKNTKQIFDYLKVLDNRRKLDSSKIFKGLYNYGNQTF